MLPEQAQERDLILAINLASIAFLLFGTLDALIIGSNGAVLAILTVHFVILG